MSLLLCSQSVSSSSSHSLLIFPYSSLPFHTISLVSSIALDIQHFLKPFTVTCGEMCCHPIMIHTDWKALLNLLVYQLTWTHEADPQFSAQTILKISNTCVLHFLCCVCGLISLSSWLFLWFLICGMVQVLSLAVNFSIAILLLHPWTISVLRQMS